jgi:hypothetical protein
MPRREEWVYPLRLPLVRRMGACHLFQMPGRVAEQLVGDCQQVQVRVQ